METDVSSWQNDIKGMCHALLVQGLQLDIKTVQHACYVTTGQGALNLHNIW